MDTRAGLSSTLRKKTRTQNEEEEELEVLYRKKRVNKLLHIFFSPPENVYRKELKITHTCKPMALTHANEKAYSEEIQRKKAGEFFVMRHFKFGVVIWEFLYIL